MTIITDSRCAEYSKPGHPERPQRILGTIENLKSQTELPLKWMDPLPMADEIILRAHSKEHLLQLQEARADFDGDTPAYPNIFDHAQRSVGGALAALKAA